MIELVGVNKTYQTGEVKTPVLFDVSFSVNRGEFVAIVGGSGSGKTTLLNLMGLLDRPTSGEVRVDGEEVGNRDELGRSAVRRDRLGFIFQFHYLLPEFNVLENALMPCRIRGMKFQGVHIGGFGLRCADVAHILQRADEIGENWRDYTNNFTYSQADEFFLFPEDSDLSLDKMCTMTKPPPSIK